MKAGDVRVEKPYGTMFLILERKEPDNGRGETWCRVLCLHVEEEHELEDRPGDVEWVNAGWLERNTHDVGEEG